MICFSRNTIFKRSYCSRFCVADLFQKSTLRDCRHLVRIKSLPRAQYFQRLHFNIKSLQVHSRDQMFQVPHTIVAEFVQDVMGRRQFQKIHVSKHTDSSLEVWECGGAVDRDRSSGCFVMSIACCRDQGLQQEGTATTTITTTHEGDRRRWFGGTTSGWEFWVSRAV